MLQADPFPGAVMPMRKPSDYAHAFGEQPVSHWQAAKPADAAHADPEPMELATFRLLYESDKICLFETRDGHITAVAVDRLA